MSRLPIPGDVVLVRGNYWAVSDVKAQGLPRSSGDESGQIQHVVSLNSLVENRFDEQLRAIWELEEGASVRETQGLPSIDPTNIDKPEVFGAFLDALRWGAVTTSDSRTLQAPFRSGATGLFGADHFLRMH